MSDSIKHECGVAMLRLLKPLEYYLKKYGTAFYGINKMYLLMQSSYKILFHIYFLFNIINIFLEYLESIFPNFISFKII